MQVDRSFAFLWLSVTVEVGVILLVVAVGGWSVRVLPALVGLASFCGRRSLCVQGVLRPPSGGIRAGVIFWVVAAAGEVLAVDAAGEWLAGREVLAVAVVGEVLVVAAAGAALVGRETAAVGELAVAAAGELTVGREAVAVFGLSSFGFRVSR